MLRVSDIRALALDLDGTVLDASLRLSDRVAAAVRAFRSGGRMVLVASGRARPAALPWAAALGGVDGMVCFNGGAVYDGESANAPVGGPFLELRLGESVARRLVAWARGTGVHYHAFIGEAWHYERPRPEAEAYGRRSAIPGALADFDAMPELGFCKFMLVGAEGAIAALDPALRGAMGAEAEVVRTGRGLIEVLPPGVSKASGLAAWLARRGLGLESVLAFGDAENDLSMLLEAGIGVAMGNASSEIRARVGLTCPGVDEDGVAIWLERFMEG